jgi:acylaminoacyl-peptidase
MDALASEEYASQSKLLQEFTNAPSIDGAWVFQTNNEDRSTAMYSISQTNLLANNKRKYILFSHIMRNGTNLLDFQWSPFPIQMDGVSAVVPSPSGSKLLVVRNGEKGSPTKLEIVDQSHVEKEIHVAQSVHGPLYTDEWFHGISWNQEETLIAYIAEDSPEPKPVFDDTGYRKEGSSEKDCNNWKGQGDWEEDWGETYSKKGRPSLFVLDINRSLSTF